MKKTIKIRSIGTALDADFINEAVLMQRVPACKRTLKIWRDNGTLPFMKLGKKLLFHWPSVKGALLRKQRGHVVHVNGSTDPKFTVLSEVNET
jgi:hypothetical protein